MGLGSGTRDPRSGKNPFRIPDPGVKKAPDPGSGSATLKKSAEKLEKNILVGEETFEKCLQRMLRQVNPGLVQGWVYRKTMVNCSTLMNLIKKSAEKLEKNISVGEETFKKCL